MFNWQLALAYFAHLLATVVWLGGITLSALIVWPATQRLLPPDQQDTLLADYQRRFSPLAVLSLAVLAGSGLMQMAANPSYEGLLQISNLWSQAMFAKHIAYLGMVALTAYATWVLLPALARARLLAARGKPASNLVRLQRRYLRLNQLNLALAVAVLAFTAVATVA